MSPASFYPGLTDGQGVCPPELFTYHILLGYLVSHNQLREVRRGVGEHTTLELHTGADHIADHLRQVRGGVEINPGYLVDDISA